MSRRLSARRAAEELLFPVEIGAARGKPGQPGRAGKEGGQEEAFSGASMPEAVEAPTRRVVVRR